MIVGVYGLIPFEVSDGRVRTFSDGKRERASSYAIHEVIGMPPRLEPLNDELDQVSMVIKLDQELGVSPAAELILLNQFKSLQMPWPLFIGPVPIGEFVITKISETWKRHTGAGVISSASVAIELLEDADGPLKARVQRGLGL